jgi:hypothetical protein
MEIGKSTYWNYKGEWTTISTLYLDLDVGADIAIAHIAQARDELRADGFLPETMHIEWFTEDYDGAIEVTHKIYGIRPASAFEIKAKLREDENRAKAEAARLRERLAQLEAETP